MIKCISFIIFFGATYSNSFFSEFIKSNSSFLSNEFQCINVDYEFENNIDHLPKKGSAIIGVGPTSFVIDLNNQTFLFKDSILKQYNKKTNQIFISYYSFYSIINKFFSSEHLEQYETKSGNHIIIPIEIDNQTLSLKISLNESKNNILFIESINSSFSFSLFNINLLTECVDTTKLFYLNYPDAFILDLRD